MLLERSKACLLLIDVQERFIPHIDAMDRVLQACGNMLRVAKQLQLPVVVTEQYPEGLGETAAALRALLPADAVYYPKLHFSCMKDPAISRLLHAYVQQGQTHVILTGVETHVCVLQTAIDLQEAGASVFVLAEAVSSRHPENRELALQRMRQVGVQIISLEMAVTELTAEAGTADFKALMGVMKEG